MDANAPEIAADTHCQTDEKQQQLMQQNQQQQPPRPSTQMSLTGLSLDSLSPTEEFSRPRPASWETWGQFYGPEGASAVAVRAKLPSRVDRLDRHLSSFALQVHGHPFQEGGEDIGQDVGKPILEVLKNRHKKHSPEQPWLEAKWKERILEDRVIHTAGNGCITLSEGLEVEIRQGDALEFIGDSDGCPFGTLAVRIHGKADDAARYDVVGKLVKWLEGREEAMYEDIALRDWVQWDRLPESLASRKWNELMDFLRNSESVRYLGYTGADLLVHIATAHVFVPVIVYHFHGDIFKAVRFVRTADAASADDEALNGRYTYDDRAHLPASTGLWLRLGLLENGHYVFCVSGPLDGEALLQMCEDRAALVKEKVQISQRSRGHAVIALGPSKAGKSTIVQVQHTLCPASAFDVYVSAMYALGAA